MIKRPCGSIACLQDNPQTINNFYNNKARQDRLDDYCKDCRKSYSKDQYRQNKDKACARSKAWYKNNPRLIRRKNWKARGIDPDIAEYLITNIKNCQICNSSNKLVPDHCHKTGIIRGVLCQGCNLAIGRLGDNYDSIKKALDYLDQANTKEIL